MTREENAIENRRISFVSQQCGILVKLRFHHLGVNLFFNHAQPGVIQKVENKNGDFCQLVSSEVYDDETHLGLYLTYLFSNFK